mmetsp:Transcript_18510/g.60261  ORF Transcript_18510/g.60261 Transcript_18510/m.60261 type:complete len:220 (-) Transcript_18510:799-1458(-)
MSCAGSSRVLGDTGIWGRAFFVDADFDLMIPFGESSKRGALSEPSPTHARVVEAAVGLIDVKIGLAAPREAGGEVAWKYGLLTRLLGRDAAAPGVIAERGRARRLCGDAPLCVSTGAGVLKLHRRLTGCEARADSGVCPELRVGGRGELAAEPAALGGVGMGTSSESKVCSDVVGGQEWMLRRRITASHASSSSSASSLTIRRSSSTGGGGGSGNVPSL